MEQKERAELLLQQYHSEMDIASAYSDAIGIHYDAIETLKVQSEKHRNVANGIVTELIKLKQRTEQ